MALTWAAPGALWLLAVVPLAWLALLFARTNFNPRQRRLQLVVRSLLLAVIALALARPVISLGSSKISIVYIVDLSYSISSRAIEEAAARIDQIQGELQPAHSRIVAFGADVQVIDTTAALRALAAVEAATPATTEVSRVGTNLERALREARAELLPGHVPRLMVFTDGRENAGDARAAADRLRTEGVPVFVEPLATRELGDAWVDRIELPARVAPGGLTRLVVAIGSQRAASGTVELREGSTVLGSQAVTIGPGETAVAIDVSFATPGAHLVEGVLQVSGDPLGANNRLSTEVVVGPRARVLYVEGTPASARYLRDALGQSGFDVTSGGPSLLPASAAQLDSWDVVVMSDVARSAISDASMAAISDWVERDGGGLLVAGGESVFGEGREGGPGGYRQTEIERLTPVTFERKDEPEVALIIVLDRSWSMAGQQMELCKTAAQAAIDVMADEHSVGVVTFNDELRWDVRLGNVGKNRDAIRKAIAAIEPSGHTLIFPAVEQAFLALKDARARAKHVVLLSDGRSYPDDYEGLVRKMVDAKITVSSIAVGAAADIELLTNIAKWGKGRSYVVEDAKEVPQIFVKEAKNAATPGFDEKAITPVVKTTAFLDGVDMTRMPKLRGRTATVLKDNALQVMATSDGDPLLAFWPIGMGRTAVFASDVKDRWATDWVQWREYGAFFAALVHALERRRAPAAALAVSAGPMREGAHTVVVAIEERDAKGGYRNLENPVLAIQPGTGAVREVTAHQTAPGHYEASVVADAAELLTIRLKDAGADAPVRFVVPDPQAEYRFRAVDEGLLRSIAEATGGAWKPSVEALRNATAHRTARRALWPMLVVFALVLWMGDILLRRVRLFEREK
jgi:uncharacterized membrane protein/uncharacterized protein YegL